MSEAEQLFEGSLIGKFEILSHNLAVGYIVVIGLHVTALLGKSGYAPPPTPIFEEGGDMT